MKANTLKSLLGILILASMFNISCNQNSPAPSTPAPTSTTATTTLTPTETALLGNWCYDKFETYSNGVINSTYTYNDCSVYHIRFNSTAKASPLDPSAVSGTYKECIDGTSGMDNTNYWQITTSGKLNIGGGVYTIETLTSTYLCYYSGSLITGSAIKYIFHKI